jgi:hypothetical protein
MLKKALKYSSVLFVQSMSIRRLGLLAPCWVPLSIAQCSKHNNPVACEAAGGNWTNFHNYLEITNKTKAECQGESVIWAIPYSSENLDQLKGGDPENWKKCLVKLPKPDCEEAPRTRTNHLGNGKGIVPLTYKWVLPHFPSGQEQRCVLRIRYVFSGDSRPHLQLTGVTY